MSWRTSPPVIGLRNVSRRVGLNRLMASFRQPGYESKYDQGLSATVREGDVVWDVGANVGYYTTRFAKLVGPVGIVVAFEPSEVNFARLQQECNGMAQVMLHRFGLGALSGEVGFRQGADDLGASSQIVDDGETGEHVEIKVGDDLISAGAPAPNVMKIDVEGYEGEVLAGLAHRLKSPLLRAVGVEMHFGILNERGMAMVPGQIESTLREAGLRVLWPDSSHLLALR